MQALSLKQASKIGSYDYPKARTSVQVLTDRCNNQSAQDHGHHHDTLILLHFFDSVGFGPSCDGACLTFRLPNWHIGSGFSFFLLLPHNRLSATSGSTYSTRLFALVSY